MVVFVYCRDLRGRSIQDYVADTYPPSVRAPSVPESRRLPSPLQTVLLHLRTRRGALGEGDRGLLPPDTEPDPPRHNQEGGQAAIFRRDPARVQGGPRQVWQALHRGSWCWQVLLHLGRDWQEPAGLDALLLPGRDHGFPGEDPGVEQAAACWRLLSTASQNFPRVVASFFLCSLVDRPVDLEEGLARL